MKAVISAIGHDRPGLVGELTEIIAGKAANVEDSRMTVLGGEFAVLMSVSAEESVLDALEAELAEHAQNKGLAHLFRKTQERSTGKRIRQRVTVSAMDHPGIVSQVAGFFGSLGVNIANLDTATEPAAHTGTPIFNLTVDVELPDTMSAAELADAFESFCNQADLDGEIANRR